jgi:hypothetical protein
MDVLEGVDPSVIPAEDDKEYDELDELDDRKRQGGASAKCKAGILQKRFHPRSLALALEVVTKITDTLCSRRRSKLK